MAGLLLLLCVPGPVVAAGAAGLEQLLRQRLDSAKAALTRGDTLFAESEFREVLAVSCLQLGAAHLGLQDYAEAEAYYRRASNAVGTTEEAALAEALVAFRENRFGDARALLEDLAARAPANRPVRLLLAKVDFLLGDRKASRAQVRQTYGEEPEDLNAVYLLALLDLGEDRRRAEERFEKIRDALGDSAALRDVFLRAYREGGQVGSTPSTLQTSRIWPAAAIQPLLALLAVYEPLAQTATQGLSETGALRRAREPARSASLTPRSPAGAEALLRESELALNKGDPASALSLADEARNLAPNAEPVLLHFARASQAQGRVGEAIATYRRLLRMNPEFPPYVLGLGSALTRNLELPEALRTFETYTRLKPDDDQGFVLAGYVQFLLGDLDAASINLNRALDRNPERLEAYQYLALVSYNRGEFDEALRLCGLLLEKDPERGEAVLLVGKILRQKGELAQALVRLRAASKLIPDSAEAHYELSRTLQLLGRGDEAAEEMRKYRTLREGKREPR